ncbi:MAG: type III-B CRISPR-associated protein Cas10/Cmr2 [Pseudomonadota bacterium]
MNQDKMYFHFTLGPVQGFVAQARRTRDFWAGSFILSWLAAVAMRSVQKQQGKIIFPKPDDNYLKWLEGLGENQPPIQGSVPNRFKAEVNGDFSPQAIVDSVQLAWRELADVVWQADLAEVVPDKPIHRQIWDRQISRFFEISWSLTADEKASNILDRRKNWRSHFAPAEPGVKCMSMAGWQELSGLPEPNKPYPKRDELDRFWQPIRDRLNMDLADEENLCAIAFVKRRFACHFEKLGKDKKVEMPGGWELKGWKLKTGVPSVSYLAAVHWLEQVILSEEEDKLDDLQKAADALGAEYGEWQTDIRCIDHAYRDAQKKGKNPGRLKALDGSVFFEEGLQSQPTPFYAILLMDGDSLGKHMSDTNKQAKISDALEKFTRRVPGLVYSHNGFLVYAGGDDVLAILPLEDALSCAKTLRDAYGNAFEGSGIDSTLSGAVEFAHIKMPLTKILRDAHGLLDNVAKDGCGRDAIAVRVWKPGGKALEWAMPWKKALAQDETLIIERLAGEFRDDEDKDFSSNFFYRIRERFDLLNPPKGEKAILNPEQANSLLAADYLGSGVNEKRKVSLRAASEIIGTLLTQCRLVIRVLDDQGNEKFSRPSECLKADGAFLVRFLANKGVGR